MPVRDLLAALLSEPLIREERKLEREMIIGVVEECGGGGAAYIPPT